MLGGMLIKLLNKMSSYCLTLIKPLKLIIFFYILFFSVSSKAEVFLYFCNNAEEFNWESWNGPWFPVKEKFFRKLFFEIDKQRFRARTKYLNKWYSWTTLIKRKDFFEWSYSSNYTYKFYIDKNEIIELQGSLYLLYQDCEKLKL